MPLIKKVSNADTKRLKISQAQQNTLLEILVAAIIVGVAIVLSIYFVKYISFNTKIIAAKDDSLKNYEKSIINVGICKDTNNDGKMSDKELDTCSPNQLSVNDVQGSLRYNVMANMANNKSLETVARGSLDECYDANNKKIDFNERYQNASSEEERDKNFQLMRMCSALRVIPDALPAQENVEALMASLNEIFIVSGSEPESISPSNAGAGAEEEDSTGIKLGAIPFSMELESDSNSVYRFLTNTERSIREFKIGSSTIEWSGDERIKFQALVGSYYVGELSAKEDTVTINSKGELTKSSEAGSSTTNAEGGTN